MSFRELYSQSRPVVSLEFFPPRKADALPMVMETIRESVSVDPDFITITYGAGGGTRELTRQLVSFVNNEIPLPAAAHLTCVGHSKIEIDAVLDSLQESGISRIVALRGDPPKGQDDFIAHPDGFQNAMELTEHIAKRGGFSVAVAGYPETHQEAASPEADIAYLKRKVDAGADVILTQLFFDPEYFLSFRDRATAAGISVPIVPGIMPISNVAQVQRFTSMCGATLPESLLDKLLAICEEPNGDEAVVELGIQKAVEILTVLMREGAPGVHLYTLNKSHQVSEIIARLRNTKVLLPSTQGEESLRNGTVGA